MDIDKELKNYIGAIIKYANKMYLESNVCDKDDLIQAGTIGMMNGLNSFSKTRAKEAKIKKTTYVIICIQNAILQEANKFYGPMSLPHNKRLRLNSFKKLQNSGADESEIKTILKMNDAEYSELDAMAKQSYIAEIPQDIENEEAQELNLSEFLEEINLSDEEKQLLKFKFQGMSYAKIAEHYGSSRETIRKRVHKIFSKIRNKVKEEKND